ncbi:MAG: hypothetical protein KKB70_07460 [Proteobacteria bacterium]|nr:hypothetical protein [Pseudomonadota bacterium]MBU1611256.1 hypothetical protein [Pseudomonadota bacterium]
MPRILLIALLLLCVAAPAWAASAPSLSGEWIGAPCLADTDCGELKCCQGACAKACTKKNTPRADNFCAPRQPLPAGLTTSDSMQKDNQPETL